LRFGADLPQRSQHATVRSIEGRNSAEMVVIATTLCQLRVKVKGLVGMKRRYMKLLIKGKLTEERRRWKEYIYLPGCDSYSLDMTSFEVKVEVEVIFNINRRRLERSHLTWVLILLACFFSPFFLLKTLVYSVLHLLLLLKLLGASSKWRGDGCGGDHMTCT